MEQQGHGRRIHPRGGQDPLPSPYHAARRRDEDGGRSFGWVDLTPDQLTLHPEILPMRDHMWSHSKSSGNLSLRPSFAY